MNGTTITPNDDGPYVVEGPVRIVDAAGTEYDVSEQAAIFLCRCGASGTKPFCDGTHETLHFQAAHRATPVQPSLPVAS
ncbi:MAG: CDGSH iron-sulfur domain-containing protein [Gaiellaceae bacterium]